MKENPEKDELQETVVDARSKIMDAAHAVGDVAETALHRAETEVTHKVHEVSGKAKSVYSHAASKLVSVAKMYGLAVVALIVGLIIGMALRGGHSMPENDAMHDAMMSMTAKMQGKTGVDLERAFLTEMVQHHMGAVDMAKMIINDSTIPHPEVTLLAKQIIAAQESEIGMMNGWLGNWYK